MEALGRLFNYRHLADGGWIRVDQSTDIAFLCYLTGAVGDTYTLQEATSSAGAGAQNLVAFDHFYTCTGDGSDAWVRRTQAAAATVVTAASAAQNSMCCEVSANKLSAGFKYVKLTSTGAGLVTALQADLAVQRRPDNLPAITS
jgi:hypothetical protein